MAGRVTNLNLLSKQLSRRAKAAGVGSFIAVEADEPGAMNVFATCSRDFIINMVYHIGMNDPDLMIKAMSMVKSQVERNDAETKEALAQQQAVEGEEAAEGDTEGVGSEGAVHPAMGVVPREEPVVGASAAATGASEVPLAGEPPAAQGELPGTET